MKGAWWLAKLPSQSGRTTDPFLLCLTRYCNSRNKIGYLPTWEPLLIYLDISHLSFRKPVVFFNFSFSFRKVLWMAPFLTNTSQWPLWNYNRFVWRKEGGCLQEDEWKKEVRDECLFLFPLDLWGFEGLILRSEAFWIKDRGSAFLKAMGAWTKAGRFHVEVSTSGVRSPALLPGHHNHWVIHLRAACCSKSPDQWVPKEAILRECVLMKGISDRADYTPWELRNNGKTEGERVWSSYILQWELEAIRIWTLVSM